MKPTIRLGLLLAGVMAVEVGCGGNAQNIETTEQASSTCPANTFGNCGGGTFWNTASADMKRATKFTLSTSNVAVSTLTAYVDGLGASSGSMNVVGVVYAADGSAGAPGTLLCRTSPLTVNAGMAAAWKDLPISGTCTLASAGDYYVGLLTGGTAGLLRYGSTSVNGALAVDANPYASGPSNPFGSASVANVDISIYATYAASPSTFGSHSVGSFMNTSSADKKRVSPFTLASGNVAVSSLTAYVDGQGAASGSMSVEGVVYASDGPGGAPGSLACTTAAVTVNAGTAATWLRLPVAGGCTLVSPGAYYLGLLTGGTAGLLRYGATTVSGALEVNDDIWASGPSNPFGAVSLADVQMSIYATIGSAQPPVDAGGPDARSSDGGGAGRDAASFTCTVTLSPGAAVDTAFNALSPGDVLCLETGHYGSATSNIHLAKSGTAGHPITLTTAPGQPPATIEGAFQVGVNNSSGHQSHIVVSHLNFDLDYIMVGGRVNGTSAGCNPDNVYGVQLNGGDLTFEYNELYETSVSPQYRDTALGVNFQSGLVEPGIYIRYNKIHDYGACDHFDHGMYLDFISSGEVSGNWVYNGGCSYGMGGGDHSLGCGAGIQLWVSPIGLNVHGNVIDGTGVGFYYSGSGNSLHDNVIVNLRGMYTQTGSVESAAAYSGYGGASSNTFDTNDFFRAGPLCSACTATATGNISVDPLFVDPAAHDYALQAGSPVASYSLWDGSGR